jgi:hypothetical protein
VADHLILSRITKAFTDAWDLDFGEAEERLNAVRLSILIDPVAASTPAGQACVLTILATGRRTFSHVTLVTEADVNLVRPQPGAITLHEFAHELGIGVAETTPADSTHAITTGGTAYPVAAVAFRCWWDGWLSGVLPDWDNRPQGESWNPLAGSFAGALAMREVFATVRGVKPMKQTGNIVSLWEPWLPAEVAEPGPSTVHMLRSMTIVGLGHLGQGLLWNLALLPGHGDLIVLQDYQKAGTENTATGMLTRAHDSGRRKTRIASDWIEHFGWETALIERKFLEWARAEPDDPAVVISALDDPAPRRHILAAGFHRMVDIGVGHGPIDFEIGQFRSFKEGDTSTWMPTKSETDVNKRLTRKAYQSLDACGAFPLASASVAVPFVGAALGAICIAQLLRLGAMKGIPQIFQMELTAPEMTSCGTVADDGPAGFGSVEIDLTAAARANEGSMAG